MTSSIDSTPITLEDQEDRAIFSSTLAGITFKSSTMALSSINEDTQWQSSSDMLEHEETIKEKASFSSVVVGNGDGNTDSPGEEKEVSQPTPQTDTVIQKTHPECQELLMAIKNLSLQLKSFTSNWDAKLTNLETTLTDKIDRLTNKARDNESEINLTQLEIEKINIKTSVAEGDLKALDVKLFKTNEVLIQQGEELARIRSSLSDEVLPNVKNIKEMKQMKSEIERKNTEIKNMLEKTTEMSKRIHENTNSMPLHINNNNITTTSLHVINYMQTVWSHRARFNGRIDFGKPHPIQVLKEFKNIMKQQGVSLDLSKDAFMYCLEEEALDWFRSIIGEINNFKEIENLFLKRYWGEKAQSHFTAHLYQGYYNPRFHGDRVRYLEKICNWAKFMTVPLSESYVLDLAVKHFEPRIINALSNTERLLERFTSTLENLETRSNMPPPLFRDNRNNNNYRPLQTPDNNNNRQQQWAQNNNNNNSNNGNNNNRNQSQQEVLAATTSFFRSDNNPETREEEGEHIDDVSGNI